MKRRVLVSLLVIAVVAGLVGAGTWAYFSDDESSVNNTFTSGTLNLQLNDGDPNTWADGASATWQSPSNWAPGGPEVVAELSMRNMGSVGVKLVGIRGENLGSELADAVLLTTITYTEYGTYLYPNLIGYYTDVFDGNSDEKVTLREFVDSPYTACFWIGNPPSDALPDYLPPVGGRAESVKLGFTFDAEAGNDYQGLSTSFDLKVTALQSFEQIELLGWGPASYGYGQ